MSRWGELIPHREDDEGCLCGCQDDIVTDEADAPPVDEYRLSTRRPASAAPTGLRD